MIDDDNKRLEDETPIDVSPEDETPDADRPLASDVAGIPKVRSAGPDAMTEKGDDPAEDWDEVDQAVDESFPASDPPGQGVG
ncbi:hypothetical protein [Sandarakinorhabdus sp. DWP1-3-1]|uniref:hypothetical protein n=1 Tax=Sandarakinorhabdus sp. DWP1-3-1 TaxID=2804627 RepID=UPI003CF2D000